MAAIVFEQVSKVYDNGFVAVKDLNLAIAADEFLVLVGPSGCGKTTTLRMLAGLETISQGHLYIDGRRVNDLSPRERDIAMVFQSYALYPHMTVFDNMAFSLQLQGTPKSDIRQRVHETARQLGLVDLLERKPKQLSGGQRQRVAVGRAMVRNPAVFLMDEPLSNLDAQLRLQARTELIKLHQKLGTTFIYVTHDQVEAMTMGGRIAVLHQGILQQVDTPQTLYDKPSNVFVAGFLGSPAMNFLEGSLELSGETLIAVVNDLKIPLPPGWRSLCQPYPKTPVLVGIRPEHIQLPVSFLPACPALTTTATVSLIERLGHESIVHFNLANGSAIVSRSNASTNLVPGETVPITVDLQHLHLFDRVTGYGLL